MPSNIFDYVKRATDIVVSGSALVVLSPVIVATGLAVRKKLGSPVLFRQDRPGQNGEVFELIKFRSMLEPSDEMKSDDERLTSFGKKLRATSLDELPTLINVLRGDMSLVGPRPLLVKYLNLYSAEQFRRHEVRPGITGLAQVSGRNALTWDEKFALDVEYVDRRSTRLDFSILLATVGAVFRREGIAEPGRSTMSEFLGSTSETEGSKVSE